MRLHLHIVLTVLVMGLGAPVMAQTGHGTHGAAKPASAATSAATSGDAAMADGLIKKVDKSRRTVTLAHGALPNGMPPMTMAYKVKDAAWLDKMKVGQKIRFATDPKDGDMTVLRYELLK